MRNYEELFNELFDLEETVCLIKGFCCFIVKTERGYFFQNISPMDFIQCFGSFNEEMILAAIADPASDPLKVDKPGYYAFKAILSYDEGESDEYGRYYALPYLLPEHIEFKYLCSFEEMQNAELESIKNNEVNLFPFL